MTSQDAITNTNPIEESGGPEKPTVLDTIRALQARKITGASLSQLDRRGCVEHLTTDGYSLAEIADILKVSERTIARDRKAIQETYAMDPDPKLVGQIVGRLAHEVEQCIARIRRAARDKDASPAHRIEAEHRCFEIFNGYVLRLQQLGYLPTAAHRLEANLKHDLEGLPHFEDIVLEMNRLRVVAEQSENSDLIGKLGALEQITARASLASQVHELAASKVGKEAALGDAT